MQTTHFSFVNRLLLAGFALLFSAATLLAQKTAAPDKQPEYPGGIPALIEFLSKNIEYPAAAKKENAEGMVLIKFVVGTDGTLSKIKTVSESSQNPRPDFVKEAVRVVKSMPRWTPGESDGKKVETEMALPIKFKLDGGKKP